MNKIYYKQEGNLNMDDLPQRLVDLAPMTGGGVT